MIEQGVGIKPRFAAAKYVMDLDIEGLRLAVPDPRHADVNEIGRADLDLVASLPGKRSR